MLRSYDKDTKQEELYYNIYKNQTYSYVVNQKKKYSKLNNESKCRNDI